MSHSPEIQALINAANQVVNIVNNPAQWTTNLPTESGFYWFKDAYERLKIVEWDQDMQWLLTTGNEIPWGERVNVKITGEFWPIKLTPPL